MNVGDRFTHIKYKWSVTVLYIGKVRAFCFKHGDDIESSWEIDLLLDKKEFLQTINEKGENNER